MNMLEHLRNCTLTAYHLNISIVKNRPSPIRQQIITYQDFFSSALPPQMRPVRLR